MSEPPQEQEGEREGQGEGASVWHVSPPQSDESPSEPFTQCLTCRRAGGGGTGAHRPPPPTATTDPEPAAEHDLAEEAPSEQPGRVGPPLFVRVQPHTLILIRP